MAGERFHKPFFVVCVLFLALLFLHTPHVRGLTVTTAEITRGRIKVKGADVRPGADVSWDGKSTVVGFQFPAPLAVDSEGNSQPTTENLRERSDRAGCCTIIVVQQLFMKTLNISEVRDRLPEIVDGVVRSNEAVVITRYGRPVASIQPFRARESAAERYPLRGTPITVADDFDESMQELWEALAVSDKQRDYRGRKRSKKANPRS